jgi:hypothetical protein
LFTYGLYRIFKTSLSRVVINFGLRRSSVLYLIKHGVACERFNFKWLKQRPIWRVHWRSNFKNKRCPSRENQSVNEHDFYKAAKIIIDAHPLSSASESLRSLNWQPLTTRRHFHRCLIMHKCLNNYIHIQWHPQLQHSKQTEHTFGTREEELGEAGIQLPCCQRLE